jgi:hypothetical protein
MQFLGRVCLLSYAVHLAVATEGKNVVLLPCGATARALRAVVQVALGNAAVLAARRGEPAL